MRGFVLILFAGLFSAVLGGGFGWLLGGLSPEFITSVSGPAPAEPQRYGAALGLVCGLFLGAAAMSFGLFVDLIRLRVLRGRGGPVEGTAARP